MADKILYHYCSTQTGLAILQSRTFRLSALSAANDSLEGRVLGRVFSDLLSEVDLSPEVADVVSVIVQGYPDSTEGFAFCLSEKEDLLSQWRAYSQDGTGISIGFSSEVLAKDFGPVNFGTQFYEVTKVGYGEEGLRKTLKPFVDEVVAKFAKYGSFVKLGAGTTREHALNALADRGVTAQNLFQSERDDAPKLLSQLMKLLAPLHFQVYNNKLVSFHEEAEWRVLRFRHKVALPEIEYFANDCSFIPYIPCLIADPAREVIREVVLGPKHTSKVEWIRAFLVSVGLPHVLVRRSTIESYR